MAEDDFDIGKRLPGYIKLDAVTCRRGNLGKLVDITYDAEIAFHDKHYVVSTGHKDYKEAKAAAQKIIDTEIEPKLLETGRLLLCRFPEAKE